MRFFYVEFASENKQFYRDNRKKIIDFKSTFRILDEVIEENKMKSMHNSGSKEKKRSKPQAGRKKSSNLKK
jgi:hypothetical protein